jgi:hypothetical protein
MTISQRLDWHKQEVFRSSKASPINQSNFAAIGRSVFQFNPNAQRRISNAVSDICNLELFDHYR